MAGAARPEAPPHVPAATQTYYQILGIGEDATSDEISAARRGMIKAVHPDLAGDEADRLEREQLSRAVNDMCDTLLDPIRRYDYDTSLARARRWPDGEPERGPSPEARRSRRPAGPPEPSPFEMDEEELQAWEAAHAQDLAPDPDAGNPLVHWIPALARVEEWLTWRVAILGILMFGVSTYLYNDGGRGLLDKAGLHFGRFGSLAVVLLLTVLLLALCLALLRLGRAVRLRSRGHDR